MLIPCPRCDETDERHVGRNKCPLCECEFYVANEDQVEDLSWQKEQNAINDALGGFDTYALGYYVSPNS